MRLIIDVPDELFDPALRVARAEMRDYRERYDKPGWGWTFYEARHRFWVRGIKGGISVSLCKPRFPAEHGVDDGGLRAPPRSQELAEAKSPQPLNPREGET